MILVGPSGCGKSTALRMVAGLEEISEGELLIGGRRVNDVAPKDRDIAMVFQNYALYPPFSIGPPDRTMAGMFTVAAAMMQAGVVLSQPVISTTPSSG